MKTTTWILSLSIVGLFIFTGSCTQKAERGLSKNTLPDGPEVQVAGVDIDLLAKEPQINTPTGVQVDAENRIWVIENHTHVRQDDYPGPKVDRILVFEGYLDENKEQKISEFASGFIDGMSLSLTRDNKVLVSTRAAIIQFADTDGDLASDQRDTLVSLDTEMTFPHNGMSGLVIGPDAKLYFQCGENFGAEYTLKGSDGTSFLGKEREGGSLYRSNMDGSGLEKIGSAVWNCFAMTFDDFGNLFAVENDPDSRPPCRLLHIVKGGNYGFQFQHGRDGLSPLTSWFGQIPGTLPMVAGTGEAPSGVLHYEQARFGEENVGALLVTSWGDNEIQRFSLAQKGSSFTSEAKPFVKGQRNFYPVGLAMDDQGAVIATDWASVSYAVHQKGRIWRIANPTDQAKTYTASLSEDNTQKNLIHALNVPDSRVRADVADQVLTKHSDDILEFFQSPELSAKGKMNVLWAAQLNKSAALKKLLDLALKEEHDLLRAASVRMRVDVEVESSEQFYLDVIQHESSAFVAREAIYGLESEAAFKQVSHLFTEDDPFMEAALIESFGKSENLDFLLDFAKNTDPEIRLGAMLCLRKSEDTKAYQVIPSFLSDPVAENRLTALKWVAEDHLTQFRAEVESSFSSVPEISEELFDAYMVCFQYLDGKFNQKKHFMEGDEHVSKSFYKRQKFLLAAAKNPALSAKIRTRALSGINPHHEELSLESLQAFAASSYVPLQVEAIRSLAARTKDGKAVELLRKYAANDQTAEETRLEAIAALALPVVKDEKSKEVLLHILANKRVSNAIRYEAMRSIEALGEDAAAKPWIADYRRLLPKKEEAGSMDFWRKVGAEKGNAHSGARVFHSARYQCSSCHRVDGRGGIFGPDLSKVGSNADRSRIIESILMPSDIVTPTYTGYAVTSQDGSVTVGRLDKDLDSKRHLQMILVNGERAAVAYDEITEQKMLETSLMPANQHLRMTAKEFRDLVQYLAEQK